MRRLLALAIYMNNRPFTHYEDPHTKTAIDAFDPTIRLSSRKDLVGDFLLDAYNRCKEQVNGKSVASSCLNFITSESTNIRKERI